MDEAQQNIGLADFRENLLNYSDVNRIQDSVEAVKKELDSYNDSISTLNKAIDSNDFSNKNDLEIDIINNYLKYYSIIYEQLQSSLND